MSKIKNEKPKIYSRKLEELPLSGLESAALMSAVLEKGYQFRFRARGKSMIPFIMDGDIITVSPLFSSPVRIGEIVAFIRPHTDKLVVHRVIAKFKENLLICGDNVTSKTDGIVSQNKIIGRVTQIERDSKQITLSLGFEKVVIAWITGIRVIPLGIRWLFRNIKN